MDTDIHLALVSDPEDLEENSVTAEITPRIRANGHGNWSYKNLKELEGEYVQITGWLMLDTKHIPQAHPLPDERRNKGLKRITNWEIHPITKLEICTQPKKNVTRELVGTISEGVSHHILFSSSTECRSEHARHFWLALGGTMPLSGCFLFLRSGPSRVS